MTPIHEMKTRNSAWLEVTSLGAVTCHGVFFEANGREVGVVIRDQPEAVAKPLIEAIAALPEMVRRLARRVDNLDSAPCVCHLTAPERCTNCEDRTFLRGLGVSL